MEKCPKTVKPNIEHSNNNSDTIKNEEYEETIKKLIDEKKRDRKIKIVLIIIIMLLLLFWILAYRIGKIGHGENKEVAASPTEVLIRITQGDIDIDKSTELGIFKNAKFDGKEIIAPKSSGTYQFCIKNESKNDIVYDIKFLDKMQNFVNMKYKLKIDNIYIRGNEKEYVGIDELNVKNIVVQKDSNNIYTLEWYWEDSDKEDTTVGSKKENQYYSLSLQINASLYTEKE